MATVPNSVSIIFTKFYCFGSCGCKDIKQNTSLYIGSSKTWHFSLFLRILINIFTTTAPKVMKFSEYNGDIIGDFSHTKNLVVSEILSLKIFLLV